MEYQRKKESQLKRRMGPRTVGSTSSQSSEMSLPDFLSSPEAEPEANEGENDEDEDEELNRKPKRSKLIDVQIPRNIMRAPMVTAAMDRTNTTPAQAMHLISAVFKSAQKDGESLDLNEVVLSESTIRRGRLKAREEISKEHYEEFQSNKPEFLVLHWNGKLLRDLSDSFKEMEAILVSGGPGYIEGKLLGKNMK